MNTIKLVEKYKRLANLPRRLTRTEDFRCFVMKKEIKKRADEAMRVINRK